MYMFLAKWKKNRTFVGNHYLLPLNSYTYENTQMLILSYILYVSDVVGLRRR